ncbi:hypothetical protein KSF73_03300 [Burkholderiaceae bacterium DAT-1]|nr:hypothetical protein [Burkholderiaceae bacterium DAT-1]
MQSNKILKSAVALALAAAGSSAFAAAGDLTAGAAKTYGAEIFGTSTTLASPGTAVYTFAGGRTTSAGLFQITFSVTNSAFNAAVAGGDLVATYVGTGAPGGSSTCAATVAVRSGGAVGDTSVTFDVTPTGNCAANDTLTWTLPQLKSVSALATIGTKVEATASLKDLYGAFDTSGTKTTTLASSVAGVAGTITATTADQSTSSKSNVISVATSATKFKTSSAATNANILVNFGSVVFANPAASVKLTDGTTALTAPSASLDVSLAGKFDAATATTASVFLSASSTCVYDSTTDTAATTVGATAVTFPTITGYAAGTTRYVCMKVDGKTAIPETTPTITAKLTNGSYSAVSKSGSGMGIARDGWTSTVPFLTGAAGAKQDGFASYVRLTNTSSVDGIVNVTLTLDDGTSKTGPLSAAVKANSSVMLSGADLEAATGLTIPATSKARASFSGQFSSGSLQNFLYSPNGTLNNVTPDNH